MIGKLVLKGWALKKEGKPAIAVMGAGAVGCYYGAMLARAGHQVTLIGRAAARGSGAARRPAAADQSRSTNSSSSRRARSRMPCAAPQLVLFSVKSTDTEAAGKALAPYLARDAAIVTLQNGVDNAERLATTLGREVIPAVVYVAVEMAGAGHVRHHGRGELVIGRGKRERSDRRRLRRRRREGRDLGQRRRRAVGQADRQLRLQRALGDHAASLWAAGAGRRRAGVMGDVVDECLAVARACGVQVPGDMHETVRRIAQTMPGQYSSTAQDLARQKKTEIDHLNGFVVRKGEALGVPRR